MNVLKRKPDRVPRYVGVTSVHYDCAIDNPSEVRNDPKGVEPAGGITARIIRVQARTACWWEGRELCCSRCGCTFSLEARDKVTSVVPGPGYCFQTSCPNCSEFVTFTKPDWL